MRQKKVSGVITSYNQKNFLVEAIESVLQQTYPVHEIIVADDGSSDGSVGVIQEYVRKYPDQVRAVLNPKNQGIPRNRNSGLNLVCGDYVFVLDGDDRFLPENIERLLSVLDKDQSLRCVYGNVSFIDEQGRFLRVRDEQDQPSGDLFFEVAQGMFGILRNMLIDFSLLREVGFFDPRFPRYDGFDLTVRLARKCCIGYLEKPLAEYREYSFSDSRSLRAQDHIHDLEGIFKKMKPYLKDLSPEQRHQLKSTWFQRFIRYYLKDMQDKPPRSRRFYLLNKAVRGFADIQDVFKHLQ